jgi:hypothetical protein
MFPLRLWESVFCEVVERGHPAVATRHVGNPPHRGFYRIALFMCVRVCV